MPRELGNRRRMKREVGGPEQAELWLVDESH